MELNSLSKTTYVVSSEKEWYTHYRHKHKTFHCNWLHQSNKFHCYLVFSNNGLLSNSWFHFQGSKTWGQSCTKWICNVFKMISYTYTSSRKNQDKLQYTLHTSFQCKLMLIYWDINIIMRNTAVLTHTRKEVSLGGKKLSNCSCLATIMQVRVIT
jgi:hypothetical protein